MTAVRAFRTLSGERWMHYAPTELTIAGRLRIELGSLHRLPDRLHDMPGQLTDQTGTVLYAVVVEAGQWALRRAHGWRSYRMIARPIATTARIPLTDEAAAVEWARGLVGSL